MKINKNNAGYYLANTLQVASVLATYNMIQNFHPTHNVGVDYIASLLAGGYLFMRFDQIKQRIQKDCDKNKPKDITSKL